jgi:TolB-like protein
MPDAALPPRIVRFGDYEVDVPAGHLRKRGVRIKLRDQSFEVLAVLLEHAGEVVTREDLHRRLWPEHVFVDFDSNLNTAIARLRDALNDSADHPRFIETLPRRGYRFIASVSESVRSPRARLLVLPFANLSGDPAQEYFSDAMTDEIITELVGLAPEHLAVIARTTAMHYKGSQKDVAEISGELGVDYVVEGSVHRDDVRIALNVQLIQGHNQTHLWAKRYDIELRDLFDTRSAIAQAIATQIDITPRRTVRRPTEDLPAYNLYLQGRYHFLKATPEGFAKAKQYFKQALVRDPEFALVYDSLAELQWYMGFLGFVPPKEAWAAGIFAAVRAVEIDNTLAEAHTLIASFRKGVDYNWREVHRQMSLALELDPASPVVRVRYAVSGLMPHGRIEEAVSEIERALESDPLSVFVRSWLVEMLHLGRQYDQGIEQARRVLELDPDYYLCHLALGHLYCGKRMFDEGIAAQRRATELSGGSPLILGWLGLALTQGGNVAEARTVLERLHAMAGKAYVPPTGFAWIYLGLGEIDSAFQWLDRAIDACDPMIMPIKSYPFLDPIRADPRYLALLSKMNLKP